MMTLAQTLLSDGLLVVAANAALASLVACGIALVLSGRVLKGLPARHALLAASLAAGVAIPVVTPCLPSPISLASDTARLPPREPSVPAVSQRVIDGAIQAIPDVSTLAAGPTQLSGEPSLPQLSPPPPTVAGHIIEVRGWDSEALLQSLEQWSRSIGAVLCSVWLAGMAFGIVRTLLALLKMRRWAKFLKPTPSPIVTELAAEAARQVGLKRPVPISVSSTLPAPVAMGLFRPRVIVPAGFETSLPAEQLQSVLRHEMAHLARRDLWIGLLQQVALTTYWWNPLVQRVSRQLSDLREQICDDIAVNGLPDPQGYATALVQLAERCTNGRPLPATLGFGASSSGQLEQRIRRILSETAVRRPRLTVRAALGVTAAATLMSSAVLLAQLPPAPTPPESSTDAGPATATAPPADAETSAAATEAPATVSEPENPWGDFQVSGRVVDPDGNPVAGATVFLRAFQLIPPVKKAVSDKDGQFTFRAPRRSPRYVGAVNPDAAEIDAIRPWMVATAPGFGFGTPAPGAGITLRLAADEPITGRVTDESGQPLAGARIRVRDVLWPRQADDPVVVSQERSNGRSVIPVPAGEGLTPWIAAMRRAANMDDFFVARGFLVGLLEPNILGDRPAFHAPLVPPVVTAEDGTFSLRGVGRERVAALYIDGIPNAASTLILAANRPLLDVTPVPGETPNVAKWLTNPATGISVFGHRIELQLAPGRTIEGVVTDRSSGTPLAGQRVIGPAITRLEYPGFDRFFATTDAGGRYRIESFPANQEASFKVEPSDDQPYFGREIDIAIEVGSAPQQLDFALTPSLWITGKVVDDVTGEGRESCTIEYVPFRSNPALEEDLAAGIRPEFDNNLRTSEDGSFRVRAYPGRGIIMTSGFSDYLYGIGADTIPGLKRDEIHQTLYGLGGSHPDIRSTTIEVNPSGVGGDYRCELRLKKGKSRSARVVDAKGAPVSEIEASGLRKQIENPITKVSGSELTVSGLFPGEDRVVVARCVPRKLMGLASVKEGEDGPVSVTLHPWANLTGRLVDDAGQPRWRGLRIRLEDGKLPIHTLNGLNYDKQEFLIDGEGRFQIEGLVPGAEYQLQAMEGGFLMLGNVTDKLTLAAGESRDLGDVRVTKPANRR